MRVSTRVPCKGHSSAPLPDRPSLSSHQLSSRLSRTATSIGHFNFDFNYAKITSIHQFSFSRLLRSQESSQLSLLSRSSVSPAEERLMLKHNRKHLIG